LKLEGNGLLQAMKNAQPPRLEEPLSSESVESIAHFNRGALLELYYGDLERAEAICDRAIDVCRAHIDQTGQSGWRWLMINPHQNLGRLAGMRGDVPTAMSRFTEIHNFFIKKLPMDVNGTILDAEDDRARAQTFGDNFDKTIPAMYLYDVARLLLGAGRYSEMLAFLADREQDEAFLKTPAYINFMLEIYVRTYLRLRRFDEALAALHSLEQHTGNAALASLLAGEIYAEMGLTAKARTELIAAQKTMDEDLQASTVFNYQLAVLSHLTGLRAETSQAGHRALALASKRGDEPWQLKCHALLTMTTTQCGCDYEAAHVQALFHLASQCDYRLERAVAFIELGECLENCHDHNLPCRSECFSHAIAMLEEITSEEAGNWLGFTGDHSGSEHSRRTVAAEWARFDLSIANEIYNALMNN
jgi:tetratricopeptide (TPR) repeat protein